MDETRNLTKDLIGKYLSHLKIEKGYSLNTILSYAGDLSSFYKYLRNRNKEFGSVTSKTFQEFLGYLASIGISPRTRARLYSSVKGFYKFLYRQSLIKEFPFKNIEYPFIPKKLPEFLTKEEIKKMLNANFGDNFEGVRNKALLELLYASGLRISEIAYIKLENFNFEMNFTKVSGKGSKERIVPFGKSAKEYILKYLAERQKLIMGNKSFLFITRRGNPLTRQGLWKIIKKIAMVSGINKNITPHTIRHTFATHLLAGGADLRSIQQMLGHSDISTTEIYTHTDISHLKSQHAKFHPRNRNDRE